jgi:DNA-binding response OmpR family regulator
MAHIVIVDHDAPLRDRLARYLSDEGFRVTAVGDAAAMRSVIGREPVDLALVDVCLPGEDGLSLTRFLREHFGIGIIIVTDRCEPVDRAIGLEVGADDYVAKPCDLRELLARVKSVLRRTRRGAEIPVDRTVARFAGWEIDLARRALTSPRGAKMTPTTGEFELLAALVTRPNQLLTRDPRLAVVAARKWMPDDRAVDQYISRLRRKIEVDAKRPELLQSVRGRGYVLAASVDWVAAPRGTPDIA